MSLISYKLKDFDLVSFNPEALKRFEIKSNYMGWFGDQEVTKYNSHGLFPQSKSEYEVFFKKLDNNELICLAIIDRIKNIHVGNVSLQGFNWISRSAELAIVIGEKDYWGKGWGTTALRCLMYHGFMKMNLWRQWTGTSAVNKGMRKIAGKLGMENEGIFKDGMYLNGEYTDIYEYGILAPDFKKNLDSFKHLFINSKIIENDK